MNLAQVKAGDVVKCDVKGRQFYALVDDAPDADGLAIRPLARETWRHVTARQVVDHWRKAGRR